VELVECNKMNNENRCIEWLSEGWWEVKIIDLAVSLN
jgi:hypothetical protein